MRRRLLPAAVAGLLAVVFFVASNGHNGNSHAVPSSATHGLELRDSEAESHHMYVGGSASTNKKLRAGNALLLEQDSSIADLTGVDSTADHRRGLAVVIIPSLSTESKDLSINTIAGKPQSHRRAGTGKTARNKKKQKKKWKPKKIKASKKSSRESKKAFSSDFNDKKAGRGSKSSGSDDVTAKSGTTKPAYSISSNSNHHPPDVEGRKVKLREKWRKKRKEDRRKREKKKDEKRRWRPRRKWRRRRKKNPTPAPSASMRVVATKKPTTLKPTRYPSPGPTPAVSSPSPSVVVPYSPSGTPSYEPSISRSFPPSQIPTNAASNIPSKVPSSYPTAMESSKPSIAKSSSPTVMESDEPSLVPSQIPSLEPSFMASSFPSMEPSATPVSPPTVADWIDRQQIDGLTSDEELGSSISFAQNGQWLAVGAPHYDNNRGVVRVYALLDGITGAEWTQVGPAIEGETSSSGEFGRALSMSGNGTVAIGAPHLGQEQGKTKVYWYDFPSNSWLQRGPAIIGSSSNDQLGYSVALNENGNTLVVGAIQNGVSNVPGYAEVYTYQEETNSWTQRGSRITISLQVTRLIGHAVKISADGNIIAVGQPKQGTVRAGDGKVQVFKYDPSAQDFAQMGSDIVGKPQNQVNAGFSIDLSAGGDIIVVGSPFYDVASASDVGLVQVYKFDNESSQWNQLGSDIMGDQAQSNLGTAVAISNDGNRIAVSAPKYNRESTGSIRAGRVVVYEYSDQFNTWEKVGSELYGEMSYDEAGHAIDLSRDGSALAIGAPYHDDSEAGAANGADGRGSVRIFEL